PAVLGNVEDHAIGILELALEIAVPLLTKVEEEFAAIGFDPPLRFGEILDLKAEMVRADIAARVFQIGCLATGALNEIKERQIDDPVAHINCRANIQILAPDPLEIEYSLIKFGGVFEVLHADGKMAQAGHETTP